MSTLHLSPELEARMPKWLRVGFLTMLLTYDVVVIIGGVWGLLYAPPAVSKELATTALANLWAGTAMLGGLLSLVGAVKTWPVVESLGYVLVAGAYITLALSLSTAALSGFNSYAVATLCLAAGIGSLVRLGRLWLGVYLAGAI